MTQQFLNYDKIESFEQSLFTDRKPFPWFDFEQFLTPEGFEALYQNFPSLALFEQHNGIERMFGQRPHNRYYLAYETSIYGTQKEGEGLVKYEQLPQVWQAFIHELETSEPYHQWIKHLFQVSKFEIRYAWHVGMTHSEVSPHADGMEKIGTHIFYFNTQQDWNPDWGGSVLVLDGKSTDAMNPEFTDFTSEIPAQIIDNHSFLFKNTPDAWHGVKPLTCPEGAYRRLFNVIFETPRARRPLRLAPVSMIKRLKSLIR